MVLLHSISCWRQNFERNNQSDCSHCTNTCIWIRARTLRMRICIIHTGNLISQRNMKTGTPLLLVWLYCLSGYCWSGYFWAANGHLSYCWTTKVDVCNSKRKVLKAKRVKCISHPLPECCQVWRLLNIHVEPSLSYVVRSITRELYVRKLDMWVICTANTLVSVIINYSPNRHDCSVILPSL